MTQHKDISSSGIALASEKMHLQGIEKAAQLCASDSSLLGRDITIVNDSMVAVFWINDDGFENLCHVDMVYNLAKLGSSMAGDFIQWGDS